MNCEYLWKETLIGFSDKWSVGCKRKKGVQDNSMVDRVDRMQKVMERSVGW